MWSKVMVRMLTWVSTTFGSISSICTNTSSLKLTNTGGDCKMIATVKIYLQGKSIFFWGKTFHCVGVAKEKIARGTLLRIVFPSLSKKFIIMRFDGLVGSFAQSGSCLSKGSSASFGSPKLQSARLRSWGEVEVEADMEEEAAMDEEVVMALSNTLGQVCSLEINLVMP